MKYERKRYLSFALLQLSWCCHRHPVSALLLGTPPPPFTRTAILSSLSRVGSRIDITMRKNHHPAAVPRQRRNVRNGVCLLSANDDTTTATGNNSNNNNNNGVSYTSTLSKQQQEQRYHQDEDEEEQPPYNNGFSTETSTATTDTTTTTTATTTTTTVEAQSPQREKNISLLGYTLPLSNILLEDLPPQSILLLNAVAIIWGSQHSVIKMIVDDTDPALFTLIRFGLGAIIATVPLLLFPSTTQQQQEKKREGDTTMEINNAGTNSNNNNNDGRMSTTALRWGLEMGFWMFLGFAFQAIGLQYTTAAKSGFLLYLNVKFVPFFAFVLFQKQISLPTWISALTAVIGTALLAYDPTLTLSAAAAAESTSFSSIVSGIDLNIGDLWSIAAAAASAIFILRLEKATQMVPSSALLNACSLWFVTLFSILWIVLTNTTATAAAAVAADTTTAAALTTSTGDPFYATEIVRAITQHPWEVIYLSGITTALANYVQTKAQKEVSAERASVIYAMDPVYGAFFANVLLGESLTVFGYFGAGLIALAAATNAFIDLTAPSSSSSSSSLDKEEPSKV